MLWENERETNRRRSELLYPGGRSTCQRRRAAREPHMAANITLKSKLKASGVQEGESEEDAGK